PERRWDAQVATQGQPEFHRRGKARPLRYGLTVGGKELQPGGAASGNQLHTAEIPVVCKVRRGIWDYEQYLQAVRVLRQSRLEEDRLTVIGAGQHEAKAAGLLRACCRIGVRSRSHGVALELQVTARVDGCG